MAGAGGELVQVASGWHIPGTKLFWMYRKYSNPHNFLSHGQQRPVLELRLVARQYRSKMSIHTIWRFDVQAKNHHAGQLALVGSKQSAKPEVHGQQDLIFKSSLLQDVRIHHLLKTEFTQMDCVMTLITQPPDSRLRDAHIGQEAH